MGSKERVKDGIKYGLIYTFGIMMIGFVGLELFAEPFAGILDYLGKQSNYAEEIYMQKYQTKYRNMVGKTTKCTKNN